jgi:hypothetical protein
MTWTKQAVVVHEVDGCEHRVCPFYHQNYDDSYCNHPDGTGKDLWLMVGIDRTPPVFCPLRRADALVRLRRP